MRKIVILQILFIISLQAIAQTKYEKETRVRKDNVPAIAVELVDSFKFNSRIKWYKEEGLHKISFEAKTRYKAKNHSVEFSEDGTFEDIEIEIVTNEIIAETYDRILDYLADQHHKYIIEKIQVQYSGNSRKVLEFFRNKEPDSEIVINYELVISCKTGGTFKMLEYLFSESGRFIRKSEIMLNKTDNIEF